MVQDGYQFQFNSSVFPTILPVVEPISKQNDPVSYALSSAFSSIFNSYITPSFQSELQKAGLIGSNLFNPTGSAVGSWITNPLTPALLTTANYQFPLVSLYRENEEYHQLTMMREGTFSHFVLEYILPPLTQPQYNQLYSFLHLVSETVLKFGFQGRDPLYLSGASILQQANISFSTWQGAKYTPITIIDNKSNNSLFYPRVTIKFTVFEEEYFVADNYQVMTGADITVSNINDGYSPVDGYTLYSNQQLNIPASISSFNPTSGSKAGTNWVAVSGQGFLQLQSNPELATFTVAGVPVLQQLIKTDNLLLLQLGTSLQAISGVITVVDAYGNNINSIGTYNYV